MPGPPIIVTCDPTNSTASPDPVPVSGADVVLIFKLKDPSQWQWGSSPAIVITNGSAQFTAPALGNDGAIRVTDANTDALLYSYTFNAVRKSSGKAVSIDPSIQNSADNLV